MGTHSLASLQTGKCLTLFFFFSDKDTDYSNLLFHLQHKDVSSKLSNIYQDVI